MRSREERVAAVKRRTAQLEAERRRRRRRAAALGSAAACLLLIICLSFAMPGISARLAEEITAYTARRQACSAEARQRGT